MNFESEASPGVQVSIVKAPELPVLINTTTVKSGATTGDERAMSEEVERSH